MVNRVREAQICGYQRTETSDGASGRGPLLRVGEYVVLTVEAFTHEAVVVVTCRGRIVLGTEGDRFDARLSEVTSWTRRIVLDLREVAEIDAHGIGLLAKLIRRARGRRVALVLATRPGFVRHLLTLTRLDTQVPCVLAVDGDGGSRLASDGEGYGTRIDAG